MACNTNLTSILKGCDNNAGGLTNIYLAPAEQLESTTLVAGEVTAISMTASAQFVEFSVNKNSASYVEEAGIDLTAGSTFYTTTLTLTIPRREVAKRQSIALIAAGQRNLAIIIRDANGLYWFMGYAEYANLTGLGEGSGAAKADGSKYALTFLAEEAEMMPEVDSTIIPALLIPAV
jgi:hypothetical protein